MLNTYLNSSLKELTAQSVEVSTSRLCCAVQLEPDTGFYLGTLYQYH